MFMNGICDSLQPKQSGNKTTISVNGGGGGGECSPSPTHKFLQRTPKTSRFGNPHSWWQHSERRARLQSLWDVAMFYGRSPVSYAAGHMHAMHRHQSSSRGSNMIWVIMSVFLFTYSRKWATDCKSKEKRVLQQHEVGEGTPEDFQEWCTTFCFFFCHLDMQWCPQVDFFFPGLIKEVLYREEECVMMTWTFDLPAKIPMRKDKKVPLCMSNLSFVAFFFFKRHFIYETPAWF